MFLEGGGETGALIRAMDWSATIGPPERWPNSLKTAVSLMLSARHPTYIAWGPELMSLYNDGYIPIVGTKHPAGIGQPFRLLWAEIWADFAPIVARTLSGEAQFFEDLAIPLAGRPGVPMGYFSFSYTPLRDDAGDFAGFFCTALETTERRLEEVRRAEREQRFQVLAGNISSVFYLTDIAAGRVTYVSPAYETVWGRAPERLFDDAADFMEAVHPDDRADAAGAFARQRQGEATEVVYRITAADGSQRWIQDRSFPAIENGRKVAAGVANDITTRKQAELHLAELAASLEARVETAMAEREDALGRLLHAQKLEALGQLTSGIAHDFNNLVAAISGGFSIIERRSSDPRVLEVARHGVNAANRAAHLVKQLLSFARQEVLTRQTVDVGDLLADAAPLLHQTAGAGIVVTIEVGENIGFVRVDRVMLETALINLVANARDAMPRGGAISIVATQMESRDPRRPQELPSGHTIELLVADTGDGIPAAILQRVSEPFFTTKGVGKGTGLGLAMVDGFIRQSAGAMRIDSVVGQGTTLRLYLPRIAVGDLAPTSIATAGAALSLVNQGAHILIVDDDHDVRAITAAQLDDFGFQVSTAANGVEAAAMIGGAHAVDAVLCDVVLPTADGPTIIAHLRRLNPALPVLFMTGHASKARLDGEWVLEKPFTPEALLGGITHVLRPGSSEREVAEIVAAVLTQAQAPGLRRALTLWQQLRGSDRVAQFARLDLSDVRGLAPVTLFQVDFASVPLGLTVIAAAGGGDVAVVGAELPTLEGAALTSWEAACRRCAHTQLPCYDDARSHGDNGETELFERLVLPFSQDGRIVDRLVGLVAYSVGMDAVG